MRRGLLMAVSSALLFLASSAPCHMFSQNASGSSASAAPTVLISEFYPCGLCGDEYISLVNPGSAPVDLAGWNLTDGEGVLRFQRTFVLLPGDTVEISFNETSFIAAYDRRPGITVGCPEGPVLKCGSFRLGDAGDQISLVRSDGSLADSVAYGTVPALSAGWLGAPLQRVHAGDVLKRCVPSGSPLDTDRDTDWCLFRERRYGYTEFPPATIGVGPGDITAFLSPDSSLAQVSEIVRGSTSSLLICTYELDSFPFATRVLEAAARGVHVSVLVDGAPSGGISKNEMTVLSAFQAHGIDVRVLLGNVSKDAVQHLGRLHSKYMVIDGAVSVIMSENFVESGLPSDVFCGNRGWGVAVRSEELAGYLTTLFEADARRTRPDVRFWSDDRRFDPMASVPELARSPPTYGVQGVCSTTSSSSLQVLISPDCSEFEPYLASILRTARSALIEQFQADILWEDLRSGTNVTNPLVAAVWDALSRGGDASLLLDSNWFNSDRNRLVADSFNAYAGEHRLSGVARLIALGGPATMLHNKGAVLDGRKTLVSSNNWVCASFAKNREIALLIDNPEIAQYFSRAFMFDWDPDETPPIADAGTNIDAVLGERLVISGFGSSDDRAIRGWSWDLYGDEVVDSEEPVFEFYATRPGRHALDLTVTDEWGNTDTTRIYVSVSAVDHGAQGGRNGMWTAVAIAGGAFAACSLVGVAVASHRLRRSQQP